MIHLASTLYCYTGLRYGLGVQGPTSLPAPPYTWLTPPCRYDIKGLVIDPYNYLSHTRPDHISETTYVSRMMSKIKRYAQQHNVAVWLVAHPRQMLDWKGAKPSLYDISGSAHFVNKADNVVVVHRYSGGWVGTAISKSVI